MWGHNEKEALMGKVAHTFHGCPSAVSLNCSCASNMGGTLHSAWNHKNFLCVGCYRQGCRAMPVPYVFDNPLFFFPLWRPTERKNTKNLTFSRKTMKNHKKP